MNARWSYIIIVACLVLLPTGVSARDLTVSFEEYPPYEYVENGEMRGVNLELIREAFRRMGIKPTFEPRPWKRGLYELRNGAIVALSSGFKTPEREEFAYFPSEPLAMEQLMIVASADSELKLSSLDDLRGLRVGVVREYTYGSRFDNLQGMDRIPANSNAQLLRMLFNGRMDVIIANKAVIRHLARETGKLDQIRFLLEVTSEPLYIFFSKARGTFARDLARDFGKAIKAMRKDGTFASIETRY